MQEQVKEKDDELQLSKKQELGLRKRERELEEKENHFELEFEKKISEESENIRQKTIDQITKEHLAKDLEKDKKLSDMTKQIEELKRKAEQGSQQTQGEAIELEFERLLQSSFGDDEIEPIAKGVKGADIFQKVRSKRRYLRYDTLGIKKHKKMVGRLVTKIKGWPERAKSRCRCFLRQWFYLLG